MLAGEPLPVFAGVRSATDPAAAEPSPLRVWRDGTRALIEESDGTPNLIVGDDACWRFEPDHEAPTASPARAVHYAGSGTRLRTRRNANELSNPPISVMILIETEEEYELFVVTHLTFRIFLAWAMAAATRYKRTSRRRTESLPSVIQIRHACDLLPNLSGEQR